MSENEFSMPSSNYSLGCCVHIRKYIIWEKNKFLLGQTDLSIPGQQPTMEKDNIEFKIAGVGLASPLCKMPTYYVAAT